MERREDRHMGAKFRRMAHFMGRQHTPPFMHTINVIWAPRKICIIVDLWHNPQLQLPNASASEPEDQNSSIDVYQKRTFEGHQTYQSHGGCAGGYRPTLNIRTNAEWCGKPHNKVKATSPSKRRITVFNCLSLNPGKNFALQRLRHDNDATTDCVTRRCGGG
eukprot:EG_transcript_32705